MKAKSAARKLIAMAQAGKLNDIVETLTPRFLHRGHANNESLKKIVRDMATESGAEAFVRQTQAIMTLPDSWPLLASIQCSTLVLVGDGDEPTPPELAKEIAGGIAGAKLTIVPGCGHSSTIEKPESVTATLSEWLST